MDGWTKKLIQKIRQGIGRPDDRTNFQDIETMIGIPDAANSSVDDILRTGYDSSGQAANEDGAIIERLEQVQEVVNRGSGASVGANKSLVDALGTDGVSHAFGFDDGASILGDLDGAHQTVHMLFVIPEAVGAINARNSALLVAMQNFGSVHTIIQDDALNYPNFGEYDIVVIGSDNGTAWVLANLAHVKGFPGSVMCVDSSVAAYLEMGTEGGDAAAKTVINTITQIESTVLGIGAHGFTGLDAGANTIADAGTVFNTLDMSDANITETWYAYESVNANTDVVLAFIYKQQPDGSRGVDETGAETPGTRAFYGCAYSMDSLNTLGQAVFSLTIEMLIQRATTGVSVEISGDIGNLEAKIFGNQANEFNNGNPMVEYLTGRNSSGTRLPVGKSIYDVLGAAYVDAGGAFGLDSIADDMRTLARYLADGTEGSEAGTALPAGKSIIDVAGAVYQDGAGGFNTENLADDLNTLATYLVDGTPGAEGGTALAAGESLVDVINEAPRLQEVVIYPMAVHQTTTELTDDGASPVYAADTVQSTVNAISEGTGEAAWSELLTIEAEGDAITIVSAYLELEWQTRFVNNAGAGTNSVSKIQWTDDGSTWVDVTDNFTNPAVAYANRKRAGVGRWTTTIDVGASKFGLRLLHWSDDGGGTDRSDAEMRTNSYVRLTYLKS